MKVKKPHWDGGIFGLVFAFIIGGAGTLVSAMFVGSIFGNLWEIMTGNEPEIAPLAMFTIFFIGGVVAARYTLLNDKTK